jgi:hypothetical protein
VKNEFKGLQRGFAGKNAAKNGQHQLKSVFFTVDLVSVLI